MANKPVNLQDAILDEVIREKIPVTMFLMNGFQVRGIVTGYDSFVVVIETEGKQQIIYNSTIIPTRALKSIKCTS